MAQRTTVIKAGTAGAAMAAGGGHAFTLNDVLEEIRQTQERAHREVEQMLAVARQEAESIRQTAREQGFEVGYTEGYRAGVEAGRREAFENARQEFAEQQARLVAACQKVIAEIENRREEWWAAARQDLVELALMIARRVVHCVGQREREAVIGNLEEAARLMGQRTEVTIAVHPADAEAARQFAPVLIEQRDRCRHVRIIEDPEMAPGGCRIQWGTGLVDASLERQLDRIAEALAAEGTVA